MNNRKLLGTIKEKERNLKSQSETTAQVWDTLQEGMQLSYLQPDLRCQDGKLDVSQPLSIFFAADKANITQDGRMLLDAFSRCYLAQKKYPSIEISGHDSGITPEEKRIGDIIIEGSVGISSDDYVHHLTKRKADAIREYLVATGISSDMIVTIGYGKSRNKYPIPLMNNRVEVSIRSDKVR